MLMNHVACQGITPPPQISKLPSPPPSRVHYQQNWLKVTQDWWVLNSIQGYLIDFSTPHKLFNYFKAIKNFVNKELFNVGHSYTKKSSKKGGLAGQNRFERCFLFNTHAPKPQQLPRVMCKGKTYQLPTVWSILSPMGIYII